MSLTDPVVACRGSCGGWRLAAVWSCSSSVSQASWGGVGPLRSLGLVTNDLQPVAYRTTLDERQIEVAVALPPGGLCPDADIQVTAFERGARVEVEAQVQTSQTSDCPVTGIVGDRVWANVALKTPLGERQVIRAVDREPLPREDA
ncbi:MAG: hypothetical protein ACJZ6B_02760 [Actinomycetes bacterium]